ncbi:MAG: cupin domain-containing protein [Actinomycetota bacterium]
MIIPDVAADLEIPVDGTLSKVLYRDDNIRVVGFAMDTGQELTEHTAGKPIIVQVVSGAIEFIVGDDVSTMGPSAWAHLEASVPHSVVALEPTRFLLTLISSPDA